MNSGSTPPGGDGRDPARRARRPPTAPRRPSRPPRPQAPFDSSLRPPSASGSKPATSAAGQRRDLSGSRHRIAAGLPLQPSAACPVRPSGHRSPAARPATARSSRRGAASAVGGHGQARDPVQAHDLAGRADQPPRPSQPAPPAASVAWRRVGTDAIPNACRAPRSAPPPRSAYVRRRPDAAAFSGVPRRGGARRGRALAAHIRPADRWDWRAADGAEADHAAQPARRAASPSTCRCRPQAAPSTARAQSVRHRRQRRCSRCCSWLTIGAGVAFVIGKQRFEPPGPLARGQDRQHPARRHPATPPICSSARA